MPIHVRAKEIAENVILCGDPKRAEYISKFLENPQLYTDYRLMYGFTGTYKGVKVSVQTQGMGFGSAAIVFEELADLGAKRIVRLGTCGSMTETAKLGDIIIAQGAHSSHDMFGPKVEMGVVSGVSNFHVTRSLVKAAEAYLEKKTAAAETDKNVIINDLHCGNVISSEFFYGNDKQQDSFKDLFPDCLACEMEAYCVFTLGSKRKVQTGCLLVVSDLIYNKEKKERATEDHIQNTVTDCVKVVLESFLDEKKN